MNVLTSQRGLELPVLCFTLLDLGLLVPYCPANSSAFKETFKLTALLRCNHVQFIHLKCTIQWFLIYSQIHAAVTTILECFHYLKKKLYPLSITLFPPSPPQPCVDLFLDKQQFIVISNSSLPLLPPLSQTASRRETFLTFFGLGHASINDRSLLFKSFY